MTTEIKTYDAIRNYAEDGIAAFASQIYDERLKRFQQDINHDNNYMINIIGNRITNENNRALIEEARIEGRLDSNRFGYNVTVFGLVTGVHTLATAIKNVPSTERFGGQKITFKTDSGWATYQNTSLVSSDYENVANWVLDSGVTELGDVTITNNPDYEDLTQNEGGQMKFADKEYNAATYSGLGRKHLRKNIVGGVNTLTQAMMSDANTIYHIQYDFTLGEDITVPANCVLEFDGGSISGGIINCNGAEIIGDTDFTCLYNMKPKNRKWDKPIICTPNTLFGYRSMTTTKARQEILKYSKAGFDGVVIEVHLQNNNGILSLYNDVDVLDTLINTSINFGLIVKALKIHYTGTLDVNIANQYNNIVKQIIDRYKNYNIEWFILFNERHDLFYDENYTAVAMDLWNYAKNYFKVGKSFSGDECLRLSQYMTVLNNADGIFINNYIGGIYCNGGVNIETIKTHLGNGNDYIYFNHKYNIPIIISETGVEPYWATLRNAALWWEFYQKAGVSTETTYKPVLLWLKALFSSVLFDSCDDIWLYYVYDWIGKTDADAIECEKYIRNLTGKK